MYFLGVDGGGTKTQILIADEKANILGMSTVGPTYMHSLTEDEIYGALDDGIFKALVDSGLKRPKITKSCFGIAGLDSPYDFEVLSKSVKRINSIKLDSSPILLNDSVCALRRGTDKAFGMVIVAGTGSNCYGKNRKGDEAFVGGLGHVLSDEGGSYYIGQRVLHAAARSYDGRGPKTKLEDLVYETFGVANMRELILKVHEKTFGKSQIGGLSFVCEKASADGDSLAHEILVDAAKELVLMVVTVADKISLRYDAFDLVCVGGTFKKENGPARTYFDKKIKEDIPRAKIIYPSTEPAIGAVLIAIDRYKSSLS